MARNIESECYRDRLVYVDGVLVPASEARISVFDHVVLYGDGVYDTCCVWNGAIFKLDTHIDRLFESAYTIKLALPVAKDSLRDICVQVVRENGLRRAYLKIIATRGVGRAPLMSPYDCDPSLIVFAVPFLSLVGDRQADGIRVKVSSMRTTPTQSLPAQVKSCNYLNHILMRLEANEAGYDDAIELGIDGYVTEAPGYNVFVVKRGSIRTPGENILYGVTRDTVLELASHIGIPVDVDRISIADVFNADEVFFASTAGGIFPVVEVDGRRIGAGDPGAITRRIEATYLELLESGSVSMCVFDQ